MTRSFLAGLCGGAARHVPQVGAAVDGRPADLQVTRFSALLSAALKEHLHCAATRLHLDAHIQRAPRQGRQRDNQDEGDEP